LLLLFLETLRLVHLIIFRLRKTLLHS
jgi:hypothetical protein